MSGDLTMISHDSPPYQIQTRNDPSGLATHSSVLLVKKEVSFTESR